MSRISQSTLTNFFENFNRSGRITDVPSSFKRPVLTQAQADGANNFLNAFNSTGYTINRNAADIINGNPTPNTARSTFSCNQPGLSSAIAANRKVSSTCATPPVPNAGDIQLTVVTTGANQTVRVNKYFANAHTIDWGDGTPTTGLTATANKTYASSGTYIITLALTGGATRWTFPVNLANPLVPRA